MKNFFLKLQKVKPIPSSLISDNESPMLQSARLAELSPNRAPETPKKLSKKFSLQSQSFSPRPILKRKSAANINRITFKSESNKIFPEPTEPYENLKRKTLNLNKIYPETPKNEASMDENQSPTVRKALKRKEKLAELNKFEQKYDGIKLREKARKFSLKRSNTTLLSNEERTRKASESSPKILKKASDIALLYSNHEQSVTEILGGKKEDPLFVGRKKKEDSEIPINNNVNFMETGGNPRNEIAYHRTMRTRKQRVNYRSRFDEKYKDTKFIIFPDDPFRTRWDLLILWFIKNIVILYCFYLSFLLYSAIILPFITAFINETILDPYFFLDIIMDGVFFTDVIINLFSAYVHDEILITDHWKILGNYLSGWFFIDLSSSIPLDLILEANAQTLNGFIRITKIPRLYKLLKMTRLVRILKLIKERNKILRYFNEVFKLNSGVERVLIAVLLILLFCHIVACLWYILNDFESDSDYEIWIYMNNLQDLEVMELYMASLYFTVQTVVTVGYGDLHCYSTYERMFASGLMLIGVFIYSFAIGSLTSLMSSLDQKNASYSKALAILAQIKKEYNINTPLFVKIKNHLKFGQNYEQNHNKLIEGLPVSLRTEIIMKIHQEIITSIPFLQNKPDSFKSFICPLLRRVKINKGDYIYMKNDPAEEMFFIKSGKVAAVFPKYDNFPFLKIKPGYYFGEIDLLFYSNVRRYTFMATKDSEFYILSRRYFRKIFIVEFRDIGVEFVQDAYLRKKRTKKIYLEALAACKTYFKKNAHKNRNKSNDDGDNKPNNDGDNKPNNDDNANNDNNVNNYNNIHMDNNININSSSSDAWGYSKPIIFKAKESIYNIKGFGHMGLGLNAEKLLLKKSFEIQNEKEKEQSFVQKENDYFFNEEVIDKTVENPIENNKDMNADEIKEINTENKENDKNYDNKNENDEKDENDENCVNSEIKQSNENCNYHSNENELTKKETMKNREENQEHNNFKILDKMAAESKETFHPAPLTTPIKKSLAAYTFQKVLNITKMNKRISYGRNLRKAAQKEALKEKIKFFTDRINKMDQDINNLINFSYQIQIKYKDKLEALKPKPTASPVQLRKLGKTKTLTHLHFLKAESLKKKGNNSKNPLNNKFRRKSDTTSLHSFVFNPNHNTNNKKLEILEKPEEMKKPIAVLRLQKTKDDILKCRRNSTDFGKRLEKSPSIIFKRKESLLEEGSLVSQEEQDLKESMFKIKDKIMNSKNILNNAAKRGSEMLSYRGSKSPKSLVGKNIFPSSISPKKTNRFAIDLKPLKRTSSIMSKGRRRSDQYIDLLKGFQRDEKGFFIEKTNKSVLRLSRKATNNSEDEEKAKKRGISLKNLRRHSENFKTNHFLNTLRNNENVTKLTNQTSSSKTSSESQSESQKSSKYSKISKNIKDLSNKSSQKKFKKISLKNLNLFNDEIIKKNNKNEINEEEKELIDAISDDLLEKKHEDKNMLKKKQLKNIGKLKFLLI